MRHGAVNMLLNYSVLAILSYYFFTKNILKNQNSKKLIFKNKESSI